MRHVYSGKVRELYETGDGVLLLVATDRISAFDYVLETEIPDKGKILTQLSLWWFDQLTDIVPNHLVYAAIPAEFTGRATACRRLAMVPVECVARGCVRRAAARRADRGLAAPRGGVHPGHQGAARRARREHPGGRRRGTRRRRCGR
jgi:phosphoribosylaminoimidazole-succinocarboxamide synthase